MRSQLSSYAYILHNIGKLLIVTSIIIATPIIFCLLYWNRFGDGYNTLSGFLTAALSSYIVGLILTHYIPEGKASITSGMLLCGISWVIISIFGAIPFYMVHKISFINAVFEAFNGFTTTGMTIFKNLGIMPRSILFWRSLMQWFGGLGILSFFLLILFKTNGAHHLFGAEGHKLSSKRPVPGIANTIKVIWIIYIFFTVISGIMFYIEGMTGFDALCHALTTISTGGFSTHDASIAYFKTMGNAKYIAIQYTVIIFMFLGGMNFLIHYRLFSLDIKALWDNLEIKSYFKFIALYTMLLGFSFIYRHGILREFVLYGIDFLKLEEIFRESLFQTLAMLTSTGFSTIDIGSSVYSAFSRQLFLMMMFMAGCIGSTSGGFKIIRIVILEKMVTKELFSLSSPRHATNGLVIDNKIIPYLEIEKTAILFFSWMFLIVFGSLITLFFTNLNELQAVSGMVSCVSNIGPSYIPLDKIINLPAIIKIIYMIAMLAGRLEILPVFLLFYKKAWRT